MHRKANQEITIRLVRKSKTALQGQECCPVLIDKLPNKTASGEQVAITIPHSVVTPLLARGGRHSPELSADGPLVLFGHLHFMDRLDLPQILDQTGAGQVSPDVDAEITELGSQARIGSYLSTFAGTGDLDFSYGDRSCTQTGDINSFIVSADVTASCTVGVTPMDFGTVNSATGGPRDSIARISVTCTHGSAYAIGLDFGAHASDTSNTGRQMANGANMVRYGLLHDNAHQGLGTACRYSHAKHRDRLPAVHRYPRGRVFRGQVLARGLYSDTVVVVITY